MRTIEPTNAMHMCTQPGGDQIKGDLDLATRTMSWKVLTDPKVVYVPNLELQAVNLLFLGT